ncbi:MAG TPA: glycerol-3-phosphate 1-O-acyltransferase PlsY [Hyphomicrobium sp.]|nr:glycerol-3-phosphate 1-O-acyltransferase PlsY [Hyphomicrobium sp.]
MDPSSFPALLIAFGLGYVLGSVPFGLLLTRIAGLGDVRQIGSGNIGATNVLRTGRRGLAAATLLLDAAKGAAAVLIVNYCFGPTAAAIAGFGALLGHIFPVWLKFKGGKGVATFLGVLIAMAWEVAAIFAIVWLAVAAITRISSLSAIIATVAVPIGAWILGYDQVAVVSALMAVVVLIKHRGNIRRLLAGEEPRIGAKA